jgi:biotin carboxyl carrier protein
MKEFQLRVKDRPYAVQLDADRMTVEGFGLAYEVVKAEGEHFTVAIDGILYEVELRTGQDGRQVALVDGVEYPIEPVGLVRGRSAAKKVERPAASSAAVEGALTAMMPSKVIAVHVRAGDAVQAGQVVLVLEAMKMESELKAPKDGVVRAVNCKQGDSVDPGVALVIIE